MSSKKLDKLIKNLGFTRAEKKAVAEYALELIKSRTIAGYDANNHKFKPLARSTRRNRRTATDLDPRTTADDSNLIRTGEMIDSIISVIEGKSTDLSFRIQSKNKKNTDKLRWNSEMGRELMGLDDKSKDMLMEFIEELIIKKLSKI